MKIGLILTNSAVLFISCVIGLLLCEVGAKFALTASDYLSVEMVPDEVLGAVPSTHTRAGGFNSWGFRNRHVPDSSDIVAIGDSHTYGNTARMEDAWPSVLERLSGRPVYNMGWAGTVRTSIIICCRRGPSNSNRERSSSASTWVMTSRMRSSSHTD